MDILYNKSQTIRIDLPHSWDIAGLTNVNIKISDHNGTELLGETAMTLWENSTISAASPGDASLTVADNYGDLKEGDWLLLANPAEFIKIKSLSGATITVEDYLQNGHVGNSAVYGAWASYVLDATDTDVFDKNTDIIITLMPDTGDGYFNQIGKIVDDEFAYHDLSDDIYAVYPLLKDIISDLDALYDVAKKQIKSRFKSVNLDIDQLKDTELLEPLMLHYTAFLAYNAQGVRFEDEARAIWPVYLDFEERLVNSEVWVDDNQDNIKNDLEIGKHNIRTIRRRFG